MDEVTAENHVLSHAGSGKQAGYGDMAARAAEIVRDDLESRAPVRMSQVETEQKAILMIVRRLMEKGEIAIGGGDDVYV